jgi:hypothetical protein
MGSECRAHRTECLTSAPRAPPGRRVAGQLASVTSFEYMIAANLGTPGIVSAIATSSSDLIILGEGADQIPLDKSVADPGGSKLIFGYIDVAEAAPFSEPDLFLGTSLPSWFGNLNPGYTNLYSVQYWNPAWEPEILSQVDQLIADGYDGIFLDVLSGDSEWAVGNDLGNPVYPNATEAMATLLSDIRVHLDSNRPNRRFYLLGNNPQGIGINYPDSLANLDAIFNEWVYYGQSASNGLVSAYKGIGNATYTWWTLAPIYDAADVPVFGNDYPSPIADPNADLMGFEFYTALGWVPSVTTPLQTDQILSTGPFMFAATPSKSTVTGVPGAVNFISGGCASEATLIGGNQGDYFIGGPGRNVILAGSGNDTIYAHPSAAALKNVLDFQFAATNMNATTPSVSILVNGSVVVPPTPITVPVGAGAQDFQVNATRFGPISSVEIEVTGTTYTNASNFSNVQIVGISYNGVPILLSRGAYSSGGSTPIFSYSNNGTIVFPASAFPAYSPFLPDTGDKIDGGGGTNTVVYRSNSTNYTITYNTDGSVTVLGNATAEGPDTLVNIQTLQFADKTISIK